MRRILWIGLLSLAGCQSVTGPFQGRSGERVDDPGLPIVEQESRGRNRWAMPDESRRVGPTADNAIPGRSPR